MTAQEALYHILLALLYLLLVWASFALQVVNLGPGIRMARCGRRNPPLVTDAEMRQMRSL